MTNPDILEIKKHACLTAYLLAALNMINETHHGLGDFAIGTAMGLEGGATVEKLDAFLTDSVEARQPDMAPLTRIEARLDKLQDALRFVADFSRHLPQPAGGELTRICERALA